MGRRRNKKIVSLSEKGFNFFHHPLIEVKTSAELGRYLVAKQDIGAGTKLFQEKPLVVGPTFDCSPVCLACYRRIDNNSSFRCRGCDWPLCSVECCDVYTSHGHSKNECKRLSKSKKKPSDLKKDEHLYGIITPLRAQLLKSDPDKWRALTQMDSLDDVRKKDEISWNLTETRIIQVIEDCGFDEFDRVELRAVCGYIQINAFAVERMPAKALYSNVFLLSHDCVPNTTHSIDENFVLSLRNTVNIKKGDKITLSYANTLQGTWQRRKYLKESKYFDCSCNRCTDPTELGCYASGMKCLNCPNGGLLPKNPLDSCSEWICDDLCGQTVTSKTVQLRIDRLSKIIDGDKDRGIESREKTLISLEKFLHPCHFLVTSVKHSLSQLYGKVDGFMIHEMSDGALERKLELCRELLRFFDVVEPGLSRIRGVTFYEMHAPLMFLSLRQFQNGSIGTTRLRVKLKEVTRCLKEADAILEFEPQNTSEGQVGLAAKQALRETTRWQSQLGKHR